MKKIFQAALFIATMCIALTALVLTSFAAGTNGSYVKELLATFTGVRLVVNGQAVTPKDANGTVVEPFIVDGTTYLPVRAVAEALGKDVSWDDATKTVYISEKGEEAPTEKPEPTKTPDPVVNNVHVPVPDHVKQNLQTPIYKLSREDAQEAIGWQFCVEVNKFRSQHGLYELDWNDTISGGLQRCNARKESATIDPYLASGGTKKLLEDMDFDNTLYPIGLKPFFRESRDNHITIDSYSTPVTIARQIMNELYDAGLGYELFAVDGDSRVERLEVKIYPYSWSDNLPTIFGAGIQFSTTAANWWESYFFQWAVGGPSDRHCRFDRDYKELGYTFF